MQQMVERSVLSLRLPENVINQIDDLVESYRFRTRTEFFEEALMNYIEDLKSMEIKEIREVSITQAKKEITKYMKKKKHLMLSDLVNDLNLDLKTCHKAVKDLLKEGKLK